MHGIRVYLVQHAEAKCEDEDPARPLTEKGWTDARRMARYGVQHAGIRVRRILHSDKLRACQTAEVWRECLGDVEVGEADGLDPLADPAIWATRLDGLTEETMLVGHLPHLSRLLAHMLCGDAAGEVVAVRNGGVICLERSQEGHWLLQWVLTPDVV